MTTPYSPLKIFHHQAHITALKENRPIHPVFVQLIPTNICGHQCNFCAYRQTGYSSNEMFNPRESIPFEKLVEIVHDCEQMGVRAVEVTGGGDPTCHPQFLPLVGTILEAGLDLGVVTNGSRWSADHVTATARAKWVRFSIDAGSEETYSRMHGVSKAVYAEVRCAVQMQATSNHATDQLVGVSFTVTKDNWPEILQAARHARADGADNIRFSACFQDGGAAYFDKFYAQAAALCREAEVLIDDGFRVFDCFADRVQDLRESRPNYHRCHFQKLCTYIGADQNLYRCCVVAYNHVGLLGSLRDRRFVDLWRSEEVQQALTEFDPHDCPRCMFNNKNRTIDYAVDPDPSHVNFV